MIGIESESLSRDKTATLIFIVTFQGLPQISTSFLEKDLIAGIT